jgi:hypothetical protein
MKRQKPYSAIAPNGVEIRRHNASTQVVTLEDGTLNIAIARGGLPKGEYETFAGTIKRGTVQMVGMRLTQESALELVEAIAHELEKKGMVKVEYETTK